MARKIRAKLIMELREQGLSRRMIAKTRRMSMESVCEVFDIAAERNIGWGDVREMADDEVYRLFYPSGRQPAAAPRRVPGEVPPNRQGGHGLHEVLRRLRRLDGRQQPHEAHRAQGRPVLRGGLVRADARQGARRPDHRRGIQGLLVRRRAAVQPEGLLRADAGHEGADLASLPCAYVRVLGRRAGADRLRQPQDRRHQAPARGRDRAQRRLRGARRALHDRHHARPGEKAQAEGVGGGDRPGRGHMGDSPAP